VTSGPKLAGHAAARPRRLRFQQHILTSLTATGRCAVLWPHGVLFRNEERAMRAKMIEHDWVEAVIGLGPNLFYNSPMESCILICNRKKSAARRGKVIFIDAVHEVTGSARRAS